MSATPPPPETGEVWRLFLWALGVLGSVGTGFLGVLKWYNDAQGKRADQKQTREDGNAAEAGRLRLELRGERDAAQKRVDELEAELAGWRGAFYGLRDTAAKLLNNALNICHRALAELEATRHSEAAARLARLVEVLERVTLPASPEEQDRPQK